MQKIVCFTSPIQVVITMHGLLTLERPRHLLQCITHVNKVLILTTCKGNMYYFKIAITNGVKMTPLAVLVLKEWAKIIASAYTRNNIL